MPHIPPGTKRVEVYLPPELAAQVEALLTSPSLGRVPHGSWNAFLIQRVNEFLASARVPMGDYEGFGADTWLSGPPPTVARVCYLLRELRAVPEGQDEAFPELNPLNPGKG